MAKLNNHVPFRLYKRGNIWHAYISVYVAGRRFIFRESTGCQDEFAAQTWCLDKINAIRNAPIATHEITLDAACTKWWLEYGQHLASSADVFSKIRILLSVIDKKILLSQITKNDINLFVTRFTASGRKNATINRYLCLLSSVCTRAKNKWDCNIPNFKILSFRLKEQKENIKYFKNWTEVQTLLNAAAPHLRPIILTALYTGLRLGRILSLKWEQIDWGNNQIIYMGKDGNPHSVPMIPQLRSVLLSVPNIHENVFTYKGKPIANIKHAWHAAFEHSGIPYRNFHTLRHTTATWLLRNTGNLKLVQTVLGHSTINVTTKYAHLVNNQSESALAQTFLAEN